MDEQTDRDPGLPLPELQGVFESDDPREVDLVEKVIRRIETRCFILNLLEFSCFFFARVTTHHALFLLSSTGRENSTPTGQEPVNHDGGE